MKPRDEAVTISARAKDKAAYVQTMFTAIADRYDFLNTLLSFGRDRTWRKFAVSKCDLLPRAIALDVATGTGEVARLLAQYNSGGSVVGIDFCPDMLAKARAKLATSPNGKRIQLVSGDVLRLPFPDNTFDCATIGFALRNIVSIAGAFREMTRVVRPGGTVVSLELTRPASWLVGTIYYVYLCRIAPWIGGLVSGKREAYTYLPQSILEFPSPLEVKGMMEAAGLERVETYYLTLGTATVHAGRKGEKSNERTVY